MLWAARLSAAALIAAGLPAAAEACSFSPGIALIHSALPTPLPEGVFIAEVEIDTSTIRYYTDNGVRARVRKVIQGDPHVSELLLRNGFITSCDEPLGNGASGLILGLPRGQEGEVLIVDPITAHRIHAFRLPDGFSVPVKCREKPCPIQIVPSPMPDRPARNR